MPKQLTDIFFYDKDGTFTGITTAQQNAVICQMLSILRNNQKVVIFSNNSHKSEQHVTEETKKLIKEVAQRTGYIEKFGPVDHLLEINFSVITTSGITCDFITQHGYKNILTIDSPSSDKESLTASVLKTSHDPNIFTSDIRTFKEQYTTQNPSCIVVGNQIDFSLAQAKEIATYLNELLQTGRPIPDIILQGADQSMSKLMGNGTRIISSSTATLPAMIEAFIQPEYLDKYRQSIVQTGKPYPVSTYKGEEVSKVVKKRIERVLGPSKKSVKSLKSHMVGDYPITDGKTCEILRSIFNHVTFHHVASGVVSTEEAQHAVQELEIAKYTNAVKYHQHAGETGLIEGTGALKDTRTHTFMEALRSQARLSAKPTGDDSALPAVDVKLAYRSGTWRLDLYGHNHPNYLKESYALDSSTDDYYTYYGMIAKGIIERHSIKALTIVDPEAQFDTTLTALASTLLNSNSNPKELKVTAPTIADSNAIITAVRHPLDAQVIENLQHKAQQSQTASQQCSAALSVALKMLGINGAGQQPVTTGFPGNIMHARTMPTAPSALGY